MGLVEAIREYLERDDETMFKSYEDRARNIAEQINLIPGIESGLVYEYHSSTGEPMTPFACVTLDDSLGLTLRELHTKLQEGDPPIETLYPAFLIENPMECLTINPEYMIEGDDEIVVDRILEIVKH